MKSAPLSEVKNDLSKFLREAEKEEVVITRHGKAAGVLKGFASEDEWFEYRLLNDPRFLKRIEKARKDIRAGKGISIEKLRKCRNSLIMSSCELIRNVLLMVVLGKEDHLGRTFDDEQERTGAQVGV
jgi:prevent-host-death family protein